MAIDASRHEVASAGESGAPGLSNEDLRQMLDNVGDVVMLQSADRRILYVSPSVTGIFGWTPDQMVGHSPTEFWHPEDLASSSLMRQRVMAGDVTRLRGRAKCADGTYLWVEVTGQPVKSAAGEVVAGVSITRDIHLQMQMEQSLAESERHYRMLADHAADVVFQTDMDGRATWVSANVVHALDRSPEDLLGTALLDLVHPDDVVACAAPRRAVHDLHAAAGFSVEFLARFRNRSGDYRWMSGSSTVVVSDDGGHRHIVTGVRDVNDLVRAREAIEASESRFRLLAENASDIVIEVSSDGTLVWVSPSVTRLLGWSTDELIGTRPWHLVHPEDVEAAAQSFAESSLGGREPSPLDVRFRSKDGSFVWMSSTAQRTDAGTFVVSFRRVEERVRAQRALTDSEDRFRLLAENSLDLVFSLDVTAIIQWVSPSSLAMLGYEPEELVGEHGAILLNPTDLPILLDAATLAREGEPATCRVRLRTKAGGDRWVQATPRLLCDHDGTVIGGVVGVRDIDDEVHIREALEHAVDFDELTGLAKRSVALARIQEAVDARGSSDWALLCLGVNGLTSVNQAYTYAAGDEVLRVVARRLAEAAGTDDRVARIAGDEFAIILGDVVSATDAATSAQRILDAVRGPLSVGTNRIHVSACIGIAVAHGQSAEFLLRDATAAMRQAALKGPDRWEFLDGNVGAQTRHSLDILNSLSDALRDSRVVPWFMPITDMADGKVVGYEALARWVDETGAVHAPDEFLPVAEKAPIILDIDRAVLSKGLDALVRLPSTVTMAVNVSAVTLVNGNLVERVRAEIDRCGVDPGRLHLEVTETALFHVTEDVKATMSVIAGMGVEWWVDDFGTGYSSISHLRDLPITGMKLDRSFTAGVTTDDSNSARLAQGLVGLADGLGLCTIAEGVETPEQALLLRQQGWQRGQGWLYGKPMSSIGR